MTLNEQLIKRLKSLMWRAGMMALAVFFAFVADNVGVLELSPQVTVILGLVLGEISKFLNTPRN